MVDIEFVFGDPLTEDINGEACAILNNGEPLGGFYDYAEDKVVIVIKNIHSQFNPKWDLEKNIELFIDAIISHELSHWGVHTDTNPLYDEDAIIDEDYTRYKSSKNLFMLMLNIEHYRK